MAASAVVLAGCGSGDVTIRGRIVKDGKGIEGLWVVLADFDDSDGMSGYGVRFADTGEPEHPWARTDGDGGWEIVVPAGQARSLGPTVLTAWTADKSAGTMLADENGDLLKWEAGRLRGTIDVGDIDVR